MMTCRRIALLSVLYLISVQWVIPITPVTASGWSDTRDRMDVDSRNRRPLVAHVVVALCDNEHQGIIPVPPELGNGDDARTNLYWGARYGVRTFLSNSKEWRLLSHIEPPREEILERIVLTRRVTRNDSTHTVYLVADAWRGRNIRDAISHFLEMSAGRRAESVAFEDYGRALEVEAGGAAHVVAYIGHNGLMEFSLPGPSEAQGAPSRSAVVLACYSWPFFRDHLAAAGAHALLLTTGLMAPEAYTLEAVISALFAGKEPSAVLESAAVAYDHYQHCGLAAARRLFRTED